MRFPLRLTSRLALKARAGAPGQKRGAIFHLDVSRDSVNVDSLELPAAPAVWISGSDSLDHANVARLANTLAGARRYVFLQTNAASLRRRIHEFRPSSRFYLVVRFEGTEAFHDSHSGREGAFRHAIDAIRSAKLAGFLVCAQLMLHPGTEQAELAPLYRALSELDLDGFLISPASTDTLLAVMAASARREFLPWPWARFAQMLDAVLLPALDASTQVGSSIHAGRNREASEPVSTNCEEGVQA
jgi:hypothetical protein